MSFNDIEALEKRLWTAADQLRANSDFASNEYFLPVMGLIFLRHAYSRYLAVKPQIEAGLPSRGGVTRPLTKEDFTSRGAIFLQPEAQFDHLASLPDGADRAAAIIAAMEAVERDYPALGGVLPKNEYQTLENDVLGDVLRIFNDPALQTAKGDVFGRIYEYFLTQFADQSAHDGGEFFTPPSIVQMIVNAIEPDHGSVLDPACGSGGMFVQSAHFIEKMQQDPTKVATFYGQEKNATTIRLAKMNLAVHGLEGRIEPGITYYTDAHELVGKADFVMANPPFNVDEVDAEKIRKDPRLPFGLPGVNKGKKVSNGNYLWISYFYSYLSDKGRAGFVMSSQASSAGGEEAKVRQKLIQTGDVDAMIALRGNFFYTRSVPCELWMFDKAKAPERADKVLMLDARQVFRKVTRKVFDFSPEQLQNLTAIFWLYRGQEARFRNLVAVYLDRAMAEARACEAAMKPFLEALDALIETLEDGGPEPLTDARAVFQADWDAHVLTTTTLGDDWSDGIVTARLLHEAHDDLEPLAEASRDLIKQIDQLFKLAEKAHRDAGGKRGRASPVKVLEEARIDAVDQLKLVRYFHRQARWLLSRFPDAELVAVPGLVKLVDHAELAANDWSLTPGRYVGVAPEEEDEDFDFEGVMRDIHIELAGLNAEAAVLAAQIQGNLAGLGL
ncbi:class I SAM-dependent DNA methyltransferase [Sphingomonas sp. Leaf20]|uniref:class I SAM-dependent DNA methyltransferase n=1 Tax=Sphingomonas sp. Leaf20 TaxID=1735685 RepID=UPI0006FDFF11|nr:N-6 DNA methylase [Sphingomonas sp. Leaf20]KQM71686.1 DNA methyltransferase [Sphingomonas sp. Leaf20]